MDHVDVYMQQAGTDSFKKSSDRNKHSNTVGVGQRLLNAYDTGEIDYFEIDDKISEYNGIIPDFKLNRNNAQKPKDNTISIYTSTKIRKESKKPIQNKLLN